MEKNENENGIKRILQDPVTECGQCITKVVIDSLELEDFDNRVNRTKKHIKGFDKLIKECAKLLNTNEEEIMEKFESFVLANTETDAHHIFKVLKFADIIKLSNSFKDYLLDCKDCDFEYDFEESERVEFDKLKIKNYIEHPPVIKVSSVDSDCNDSLIDELGKKPFIEIIKELILLKREIIPGIMNENSELKKRLKLAEKTMVKDVILHDGIKNVINDLKRKGDYLIDNSIAITQSELIDIYTNALDDIETVYNKRG